MTFINNCDAASGPGAWLNAHPLLQGLPPSVLQKLVEQAELRHYRSGDIVFHEGATAHHWLLVVQGSVELVRFSSNGQERIFPSYPSGQSVAEVAMFMGHGRYPMMARAAGATTVWRMARHALRDTCQAHPALALRLLEDFSRRLYRYVNEVEWLTTSSAPQRLAAYLLQLPADKGNRVELPFSQRQLAAYLGIRAETLSRLLSEWRMRCWIRGEKRIWALIETASLQNLAGGCVRSF